jgi:multidrug efflux pump subunit AcrB
MRCETVHNRGRSDGGNTSLALNGTSLPLDRFVNGSPVLLRDVAYVRDGAPPQINIVRTDGKPSVLTAILKNGNASTLSVVNTVKRFLPGLRAAGFGGDQRPCVKP